MSVIPGGHSGTRILSFRHQYDEIRQRRAPAGVTCPHCQGAEEIYFSSAQLRRPLYKRALFAYLRCHDCTHRFRQIRVAPLVFWASIVVTGLFVGVIT